MWHKTCQDFEVKAVDSAKGEVTAVFARFNVKDHDGDVTLPGAFRDGAGVRVSAYNHASWAHALPVGKGTISTTDEVAVADMKFFMNTQQGRETFEVVKELGALGEWSYGYDVIESSRGNLGGEDVQFLKTLDVHEVSPVLLGAGIGTGTLSVKSVKDMDADALVKQATAVVARLVELEIDPPDELVKYVTETRHEAPADDEELARMKGTLLLIGAAHGLTIETGE